MTAVATLTEVLAAGRAAVQAAAGHLETARKAAEQAAAAAAPPPPPAGPASGTAPPGGQGTGGAG